MVRLLRRLDGFAGRLLYRMFGCVTAVMTALALWAVWQSLSHWDGLLSLVSIVMFGAGAGLAGWTTRHCFSRQRTLGEFMSQL